MTTRETTRSSGKSPAAIRLPDDLLRRVDDYASMLEAELHVRVSRSNAIRRLLVLGLEDAEDIRNAEVAWREEGEIPLAEVKAFYGL